MATFITSLILWGFIAAVVGLVGKLIYDVQQSKKQNKESNDEFEAKEAFQKLAGITPVDKNDEIREILVKNNLNSKERIIEEMMKAAQNSEFPAPDQSIPVVTAKLTTIDTKFEEADPLISVPMSRVSKEAKKKMAEIAKDDIKEQVEKHAIEFESNPKKKSNPKQMDGKKAEGEFKKTRKKTTKKTNE